MTKWTLIRRSLRFHARSHLGVLLGAAVGSAVLIGALVVGDSVKESLRKRALVRLGWVDMAMAPGDRFFLEEHGNSFIGSVVKIDRKSRPNFLRTRSSGALVLPATAVSQDGGARANHIQVIGLGIHRGEEINGGSDNGFFGMAAHPSATVILRGQLFLNVPLANQLRVQVNDEVVLRVHKPSVLSIESPIASRSANATALRLRVTRILLPEQFGDFSLRASSEPPLNAFVNLSDLQAATGLTGRVNVFLVPRQVKATQPVRSALQRWLPESYYRHVDMLTGDWKFWDKDFRTAWFDDSAFLGNQNDFDSVFRLSDAELELRLLTSREALELRSRRIFLDPPVVRSGLLADTNAEPILTYLVNLLRSGTNTAPYSMVTAAGPPWTPADMRNDEIAVTQWLADDLQVKPGDSVALTYFDAESGGRLVERTNTFRLRSVVPMEMPWADRTLMPEFPGIEKAESTHDWDAGFPLVHKIRQKDEDYWKAYRGTPKAFVTLAAGQEMWGNRFGNLTAIRFPVRTNLVNWPRRYAVARANEPPRPAPQNTTNLAEIPVPEAAARYGRPGGYIKHYVGMQSAEEYRMHIEENIRAMLKPVELGLRFEPVRAQALKAAEQAQDFGQLFLGFSFFLIVATLLLMALLFQFGLEQRTAEVGTLLALGFPPRQVRRLLLLEGCTLAFIGGIIGVLAGTVYAKAMLRGLTTIWRDAVGTSALHYHARPSTLVIGLLASTLIAALTIWLTLRKQGQRPARELLEEGAEEKFQAGRSRAGLFASVAAVSAVALVAWAVWKGEAGAAGIFFSAGALLLITGLGFCADWFGRLARRTVSTSQLTIGGLGLRGCSRRRKRSLATVALLASGTFLIAAIGVFRLDANLDATKRSSGTGGFALIGESTLPVVQDLNSKPGREFFGLDSDKLAGVEFVAFRVRDGDDASCLNLNRAQKPRLLGVKPEMLVERFTFAKGDGWKGLINTRLQPGEQGARRPGNRLSGFPDSQSSNTGLKSGANEIEIPAIGDANSIQWAMGKKVGDTIDYVDERGQPFKVRIVGAVANSILQGSLIIDEAEFINRFPSESGYRMFLIDTPTNRTAEVSATLSRALQDVGLELQPTAQKLAAFNAVQNTYLNTFQILGGLGLLLGSAGLGVVVLRNVLERRGELALLLAVGFRTRMLRWLVLSEHSALLWLGLGVGLVAAIVAVLPSLLSPGADVPYLSLALTLAAVLANGMIWTWLAIRFALRGKLLDALRSE